MKTTSTKSLRCAIYTRKSTEHGLEQEFNSLDAQRESCEAYIKSQAIQGWTALPQRYDDPAYSGGTLERPAVQRLLKDIEDGRVDVVVVYKIDRLTRSLADFAKLVEIFDAKSVSFVAVTQQFNTTTSMGRLTLNVLLSFAQFERELSSERVRDKFAASRKKGKWMGGNSPFGYPVKDKKLFEDPEEAKTVQFIFRRYLDLKTIESLIVDLDKREIITRKRKRANSQVSGGGRFTYGPLAYLLKNRLYLGEVNHKEHWFKGEHKAIIERSLFDSVQALLKKNSIRRHQKRTNNGSPLTGLLFDDRGNRLSPSYTTKRGVRYRFYVNSALLTGRKAEAGSVRRVAAPELERTITSSLKQHLAKSKRSISKAESISSHVERIVMHENRIQIFLKQAITAKNNGANNILEILRSPSFAKPFAKIETDNCDSAHEPNPRLVQAIARSHMWLESLMNGTYKSAEDLADSVKMHPRAVRNGLRLAFLAPDLAQAIFARQNSECSNVAKIQWTLPLSWRQQRKIFNVDQSQ